MRSSVCAFAVSMRMGICLVRSSFLSSLKTVKPSFLGSMRSRMMRSGRIWNAESMPAWPS